MLTYGILVKWRAISRNNSIFHIVAVKLITNVGDKGAGKENQSKKWYQWAPVFLEDTSNNQQEQRAKAETHCF